MPHTDADHALKVQLATALREAEELRDAANTWPAERDALRAERDRLETAARAYIEGHELALTRAETAEAALAAARRECEGLRAKMTELAEALASAADDIDSRDTEGFREALREGAVAATEVAE